MSEELKIVYGVYDLGEEREQARWSFGYIMQDFADIRKRYISLGFHLAEFCRYEYYKDFGYPTFEEFCATNVPLDKGSISRCINVYKEFGMRPEGGLMSNTPKMWLDDKYKDYSYSQLVEMLPLDDKRRKLVKPDMSIVKIRELKKACLVSDEDIKLFIEHGVMHKNDISFSRDAVMKELLQAGKSWRCASGGKINYSFKPGKVAINSYDDYYTFTQILDRYAALPGNKLVATSQPEQQVDEDELVPLFSSEQLECDEFLEELFTRIKGVLEFLSLDIHSFERSGKQFSFKDLDGNNYKLLYMVSKKKD